MNGRLELERRSDFAQLLWTHTHLCFLFSSSRHLMFFSLCFSSGFGSGFQTWLTCAQSLDILLQFKGKPHQLFCHHESGEAACHQRPCVRLSGETPFQERPLCGHDQPTSGRLSTHHARWPWRGCVWWHFLPQQLRGPQGARKSRLSKQLQVNWLLHSHLPSRSEELRTTTTGGFQRLIISTSRNLTHH